MTDPTVPPALERACRAVAADHYSRRFGKSATDPQVVANVDGSWTMFLNDARIAIDAYLAATAPLDAAPLDHPAVKALVAAAPSLPEEFLAAMKIVQDDFFDGVNQLADETILSVARRDVRDGAAEFTVVTRTPTGRLRVHGCTTDPDRPSYGVNAYDDAAAMVEAQDYVPTNIWCGGHERYQFGLLAADPTAR